MPFKLSGYFREPIIRFFAYLIFVRIIVSSISWYAEYNIVEYHEKPAQAKLENQGNRDALAEILNRQILQCDSQFRQLLVTKNLKHIENILKKNQDTMGKAQLVLQVLADGGEYTNTQLVNFYDMDQVSDVIVFSKDNSADISVNVLNLSPRLPELSKHISDIAKYLKEEVASQNKLTNSPYELGLLTKQTESLLLRTQEDVNKIHYDIKMENIEFQAEIDKSEASLRSIRSIINAVATLIIFSFAILIVVKIKKILIGQKTAELIAQKANDSMNTIIENIPVGVILINEDREIVQLNEKSLKILEDSSLQHADDMIGKKCSELFCTVDPENCPILDRGKDKVSFTEEQIGCGKGDNNTTVLKSVIPVLLNNENLLMEVFVDITAMKEHENRLEEDATKLEAMVEERTHQLLGANLDLEYALVSLKKSQAQAIMNEKLASVGQLAAGVAHEINTPVQFVGDNISFIKDSIASLMKLQDKENELIKAAHESNITPELLASVDEAFEEADMEFLAEEFPTAIAQAQSGVERIAQIVQAMKEFSHPGDTNLKPANINKAIETTQTVTRSEWKLIADFETDFDQDMPMIPCLISEFNQVILNMIINACDAISDCLEKDPGQKGKISISTKVNGSRAEIRISDTGGGIPQSVQDKIFDPFFTTKEVGKGSGQGLAISRAVIVDKHKGELDFETQEGKGTTFIIRLPLN